jgi:hypothetical protein
MDRKGSHHRRMTFQAPFVRPVTDLQPDLAPPASENRQPGLRPRNIFVIKQGTRLGATNTAGKQVRRILIFDDHPDSLRLVFGRRANPQIELSVPSRASSWELILVSVLTMGALIGVFWPLF